MHELTEPIGGNFHPDFEPHLTPKEMLELGVFGGKYITDGRGEFPADWFTKAKLCSESHDPELNFFKVNASQPLSTVLDAGRKQLPQGGLYLQSEVEAVPSTLGLRFADDLAGAPCMRQPLP